MILFSVNDEDVIFVANCVYFIGLRAGCTFVCIYLLILFSANDEDFVFSLIGYCRVQTRLHCHVPRLVPQSLFHLVGGRNRMVVDRVERDPSEYCINQVYTKIQL